MKIDLESPLNEKLATRNFEYRNSYFKNIYNRYCELILNVIAYKKDENFILFSQQVEYYLRYYGSAVIGLCKDGKFRLIGYASSQKEFSLYSYNLSTIVLTLKKSLRLDEYVELTEENDGNCVILKNKNFMFTNFHDFQIIYNYCMKLSEIELSRFSIVQQAKFITIFRAEADDEDINQIASDFYNASPIIKTTKYFDTEDSIITLKNHEIVSALKELKNEANETKNEINEFFGIDSAGIVKESGVSEAEVNSNNDFLTANLLLYLDARNTPLNLLCEKYDVNCQAVSNAKSEKAINPIDKFYNTKTVEVE